GEITTFPVIGRPPSVRVTALVRLALSMGSLKTTRMIVFSGTSRLCDGGLVRTTVGRVFSDTTMRYDSEGATAPSTTTSMVSPTAAPTATGSNPPFTTTTL